MYLLKEYEGIILNIGKDNMTFSSKTLTFSTSFGIGMSCYLNEYK